MEQNIWYEFKTSYNKKIVQVIRNFKTRYCEVLTCFGIYSVEFNNIIIIKE